MHTTTHRLFALILLTLTLCAFGCDRESFEPPSGPGPHILVDLYHTRIQNPEDFRLQKDEYAYQGAHGYARLFDHLRENGYPWTSIRETPLSAPRLEGFDVLFINLLHAERPDFSDDEVQAIIDFVDHGGGLFVISDHTNVYYHAERANRFLVPMGVEISYHSALDVGANSVSGLGWIAITDLEDHPVNAGVDMISFQTGGTLTYESNGVVARTSPDGWGDFWNEEESGGFYGNWTRDPGEPSGSVPVAVAAEYGSGRIVVVGDQNAFGDAWVHFADNFEHAVNAFEWLAKRENDAGPRLRDIKPKGFNIGMDTLKNGFRTGNGADRNYYKFFVNLNRDQAVTGSALLRYDEDIDALVFAAPSSPFDEAEISAVRAQLIAGKRVVLLTSASELSNQDGSIQLLSELAPDFELTDSMGTTVRFDAEPQDLQTQLAALRFTSTDTAVAPRSDTLDVSGIDAIADWDKITEPDENGDQQVIGRTPSMLRVKSSWGESLLSTDDPNVEIARAKKVNNGELIVFVQDGFWRNETLGNAEWERPSTEGKPSETLQYRFLDFLKTPIE